MVFQRFFLVPLVVFLQLLTSLHSKASEQCCGACGKESIALTESQKEEVAQILKLPLDQISETAGKDKIVDIRVTVRERSFAEPDLQSVQLYVGGDYVDTRSLGSSVTTKKERAEYVSSGRGCECPEGCACPHCAGKRRACSCPRPE